MTRGKRACLLVAVPALCIFAIVFSGPVWDRIEEELKLRTVAKSTGDERARALAVLVERGSLRGIAIALEELLDWDVGNEWPSRTFLRYLAEQEGGHGGIVNVWSWAGEFTGFNGLSLAFLQHPLTQSAAGSEIESSLTGYEKELERMLREGTIPLRAQALGILFKVKAPSSLGVQWRAIQDMRRVCPALEKPLSRMAEAFEPASIMAALRSPRPHPWEIRAAAAIGLREALPRLGELTGDPDRERAMVALRSIEDFEGREAEAELARCVLHWNYYTVYSRGGQVLSRRNKDLLLEVLLAGGVPEHCRWWQGLMLGRLGRSEAVPLLVSEVNELHTMDSEMFQHLDRLASPEHRELILELPEKVRPDQRGRAEEIVRSYLARCRSP